MEQPYVHFATLSPVNYTSGVTNNSINRQLGEGKNVDLVGEVVKPMNSAADTTVPQTTDFAGAAGQLANLIKGIA